METYRYETVRETIDRLLLYYPFLEAETIGSSVMGKELHVLRMGGGEKEVFYSAGWHANEWITTPLLLRFLEEYAKAAAEGETLCGIDARTLYRGTILYLLPLVNPDGMELATGALSAGRYYDRAREIAAAYPGIPFPTGWKANIEGTDLNLQFPADWELAREIKYGQGFSSGAIAQEQPACRPKPAS